MKIENTSGLISVFFPPFPLISYEIVLLDVIYRNIPGPLLIIVSLIVDLILEAVCWFYDI